MRFVSLVIGIFLLLAPTPLAQDVDWLTCSSSSKTAEDSANDIREYCESRYGRSKLAVTNAPARHFHRAISLISPSSSFFKKVFRVEDDLHRNVGDGLEQLFDENLWKWEVHSYMFWGEVLAILGVAWIIAVLVYYIPVLISRKCCCALNWQRERAPILGVVIPGSIFGLLSLFFVAVIICHTIFFQRAADRAQCVALESVHEALYGEPASSTYQLTSFQGLEPLCLEVKEFVDTIDDAFQTIPGLEDATRPFKDSAAIMDDMLDTAQDISETVQDQIVDYNFDRPVDLIFIVLQCIYGITLLNIIFAVWVFIHYYRALEYRDPIQRPGGFHTGFAGFLTFWFGACGGLLLIVAGCAWAVLYFTSDACRLGQVDLLGNAKWNDYEVFNDGGDFYLPPELTTYCLDKNGSGNLYEALGLQDLLTMIDDNGLTGIIPLPDLNCRALRELSEVVSHNLCDSLFGDLAMISWCIFFLGIMHFIAWIYVQRFWRHRQGLVDEEKARRKRNAGSSGEATSEEQIHVISLSSGERVSDDSFLSAAQYGDFDKVVKAVDQRGRPNECHDVLYNNSPLHLASYFGHVAVVKVLLEHKYSPNERNFHQYTPFSACANNREIDFAIQTQVLRLLAQYGADVDTFDHQGDTPLLRATRAKNEALVGLLLELGADPQIEDRMLGESSLALADTFREESPNLARILSAK